MVLRRAIFFVYIYLLQNRNFAVNFIFSEYLKFIETGQLHQYRRLLEDLIAFEKSKISLLDNNKINSLKEQIDDFRKISQIYRIMNDQKLIREIVLSKNYGMKLRYPIPPSYWEFFDEHGFIIDKFWSRQIWLLSETYQTLKQNFKIFRFLLSTGSAISIPQGSTIVFGLTPDTQILKSHNEMCLENWLKLNIDGIRCIFAVSKNQSPRHIGIIKSLDEKTLFGYCLKNVTKFYLRIFFDFGTGIRKSTRLRFADEIFRLWFIEHQIFERKVTFVWLSSRSWVRPVWNIALADDISRSLFINLSGSEFPRIYGDDSKVQVELLHLWDEIFVTDANHKKKYRNIRKISVKGVPFWTDNPEAFAQRNLRQRYCAIFDIQPSRKYLGWGSINDCGFVDSEASLKFVQDIVQACHRFGIMCIHKSKRKNAKYIDLEYEIGLEKIATQYDNYVRVESDISPYRIIANSDLTISMPFTSTGAIAKSLDIPNFYYDSIGKVSLIDAEKREFELINSRVNLEKKITELFINQI